MSAQSQRDALQSLVNREHFSLRFRPSDSLRGTELKEKKLWLQRLQLN